MEYPLLQAVWKIAPAIAAGNTVVVKPAEQACLSVMLFGKLCTEAGIRRASSTSCPVTARSQAQRWSITTWSPRCVHRLDHDRQAHRRAGRQYAQADRSRARRQKRSDRVRGAPIDQAAQVAAMSIFSNMGQVCTAGSRLFLHEKVHDKVLEKVIENAKKIKLGDQMDPSTTMGPLISAGRRNASPAISTAARPTPSSCIRPKSRKA